MCPVLRRRLDPDEVCGIVLGALVVQADGQVP